MPTELKEKKRTSSPGRASVDEKPKRKPSSKVRRQQPRAPSGPKVSPEKLMVAFTRTPFGMFLVGALVFHALLIGVTSLEYMHGMIDPEAAAQKKAAAAKKQAEEAEEAAEIEKPAAGPKSEVATEKQTPEKGDGETKGAENKDGKPKLDPALEAHKDAPIVKRITDTAKPEEVPDKPDDLGISLDDSSP